MRGGQSRRFWLREEPWLSMWSAGSARPLPNKGQGALAAPALATATGKLQVFSSLITGG